MRSLIEPSMSWLWNFAVPEDAANTVVLYYLCAGTTKEKYSILVRNTLNGKMFCYVPPEWKNRETNSWIPGEMNIVSMVSSIDFPADFLPVNQGEKLNLELSLIKIQNIQKKSYLRNPAAYKWCPLGSLKKDETGNYLFQIM